MSVILARLLGKLETIAETIQHAKPGLCFLGIVHQVDAPVGWDLIISSKDITELPPWTKEALSFVNEHLKKNLTDEEMASIAVIVALPPDNDLVTWLSQNAEAPPFKSFGRKHTDGFDEVYVVRPIESPLYWKNMRAAVGSSRQ